jgi:hypothetical protein
MLGLVGCPSKCPQERLMDRVDRARKEVGMSGSVVTWLVWLGIRDREVVRFEAEGFGIGIEPMIEDGDSG